VRVNPDLIKNFSTNANATTSNNNNNNSRQSSSPSVIVTPSSLNGKYKTTASSKTTTSSLSISPNKTLQQQQHIQQDIEIINQNQINLNANSHLNEITIIDASSSNSAPNEIIHHHHQQQQHHIEEQHNTLDHNNHHHAHDEIIELEDIRFVTNEFLIHRSTFTGDFDNYDIWCVAEDKNYLQKYEPVLLSTGERCHQSTDIVIFNFLFIFISDIKSRRGD
jgi:hypothetical protein